MTDNLWLYVNHKKAEVISKTEKHTEEINISKCGKYKFEDYIFSIEKYNEEITEFPNDTEYKAYISADEINFTLRHRKDGDKIQPLGAKGSQKLKKYLNEKKIPQHEKDKLIFLCKDNEILWAAGIGISEKIKVAQKPTHMLKLEKR